MTEPFDINTKTAGVYLQPSQSNEIWTEATKQSAIMQLAKRINVPGNGLVFDTLGESTPAAWVAETAEKPVDNPTFGSRKVIPYKMAKIIPVSNEFMRDKARLWAEVSRQGAQGIAETIDKTFITGATTRPITDGMDTLSDAQQVDIGDGTYADFVKIVTTILENNGDLTGMALSPQGQSKFIQAMDANGRPLLVNDASTSDLGRMFGARIVKSPWGYKTGSPNILGVAGDWSQAMFATVGGIQMKVSDQATINIDGTQVNLWQRNMTAILLEATVGFIVRDKKKFAVITDASNTKAGK